MKQTDRIKSTIAERPVPQDSTEKEPTTSLRESRAMDDDSLVQSVQEKLSETMGYHEHGSIRTSRHNPAAEAEQRDLEELDSKEDHDELDDDQKDDLVASTDGENENGEENKEDDEEGTTSGLPDALVRCAVAYGWGTKDEAVDYFNEDPQRALEVFNRIYRARLQATSEFARLGRAAREQKEQQVDSAKPETKTVTPEQIERLKTAFGNEAAPLLDIIETQQKALAELTAKSSTTEPVRKQESQYTAGHDLIDQQINTFFAKDDMEPWSKVYGKIEFGQDWEDLSPSQQRYRHSVLTKANDALGGAQLHGRKVSLPDALEEAHLVVTQQFRDQVLIGNLRDTAVKRHRAITVKPSKSKSRTANMGKSDLGLPGNRTPEQRERAVMAKMRQIGL